MPSGGWLRTGFVRETVCAGHGRRGVSARNGAQNVPTEGPRAELSHRADSGAGQTDGVVGSRVAAGHHGVTHRALEAA